MSYNYCLTQFCETLVNLSSKNKQNCIKEDRTTSLKNALHNHECQKQQNLADNTLLSGKSDFP